MNQLITFLETAVPKWLALLLTPLAEIADLLAGRRVRPTLITARGGVMADGEKLDVPANARRKQIIITANGGKLSLRTASNATPFATVPADTSWTIETTDALTVVNASGGAVTAEIAEIIWT
jgi:hypothetical protein